MSKPKIKSIDFEVCDKVYKMTLEEMLELQRFLNATFLSADTVATRDCYSDESSTCSFVGEENQQLVKRGVDKGDFDGLGFSYGDA
ncbi:MAG: hypothetical protein SVO01_08380 [Thermotogota bacterium]|nr:hypothetical protein [Thermotogota bacterium]